MWQCVLCGPTTRLLPLNTRTRGALWWVLGAASHQEFHLLLCAAPEEPHVRDVSVPSHVYTLQAHHLAAFASGAEVSEGPCVDQLAGKEDECVVAVLASPAGCVSNDATCQRVWIGNMMLRMLMLRNRGLQD